MKIRVMNEKLKKFDAILKDLKSNGRTTKPISLKTRGSNMKSGAQNDYGFDEVFNIFDKLDVIHHELNEYNLKTVNKINTKNEMLEYLKNMDWKLIYVPSTHTLVSKINNTNYKGYANKKQLHEEMNNGDKRHVEPILDLF